VDCCELLHGITNAVAAGVHSKIMSIKIRVETSKQPSSSSAEDSIYTHGKPGWTIIYG